MEREDWMTKAMPKSAPGAGKEGADAAGEEPMKKVVHASLWTTSFKQSPQPLMLMARILQPTTGGR